MLADIDRTEGPVSYDLTPRPPKTPERVKHGKEVFAENCQCCHSLGLPTIGNEPAPELDPQPSDLLFIQDYKYGSSEHDMAAIICYGIEGTGMAPWDGILEPEDIWAVAFYVASQQKKKRVDHK